MTHEDIQHGRSLGLAVALGAAIGADIGAATGHMGVVYEKPVAVSGGYLVRIADATSYPHGEDSREGGTGFGFGSILVTVDPDTGEGTGQGWTGRYSGNTVIKTPIYVGRPLQ